MNQLSSIAQSCVILCNSMDCSMLGFLADHWLWELIKLMSTEEVCHSTISSSVVPFSSCPQAFSASVLFSMSQNISSGSQSIGISASASVVPMNIQNWFPLGLTGLISLQSKGLSRVFSAPQFKNINSSTLNLLYGPTLTSIHDYWKNHSFD